MIKTPERPVMRWHGGKWILAPWIIEHFPKHRYYTEVFGGAASVLLRKPRCAVEVYNDLDQEAVNLFRVLQNANNSERLLSLLNVTPFSRDEFMLAYSPTEDSTERARRLIIRSFMGFGSNAHNINISTGFRSNSNQSGTSPARDWANYPEKLRLIIERFRGVVIENRPAIEVLKQHDNEKTLHYVDPPYVQSSRSDFRADYTHEMTDEQHKELADVLHSLKGMVVLSGYETYLYDLLYKDWKTIKKAALADGAKPRVECIWINKAAEKKDIFSFAGVF